MIMPHPGSLFTAVVMAADRNPGDPVALAAGVSCKALATVGGRAMVLRVLQALERSEEVGHRLLCGPPAEVVADCAPLREALAQNEFQWIESRESPSISASAAMGQLPDSQPVLLTTADHALLNSPVVDYFCRQARDSGCDLLVALTPHELIETAYPSVKRTVLKFRDKPYCSCNLFAFMTPSSRRVTDVWRNVEQERKRPWRVLRILGWWPVFQYLVGQLTLGKAMSRLSNILGIRVGTVILPFPEAAVDVDTEADLLFVRRLLEKRKAPDSQSA